MEKGGCGSTQCPSHIPSPGRQWTGQLEREPAQHPEAMLGRTETKPCSRQSLIYKDLAPPQPLTSHNTPTF